MNTHTSNSPFKTKHRKIDMRRIKRNPQQPRIMFDQVELQELAQSIRVHGVIQPIVVEQCAKEFLLHDGERRWHASKLAGLKKIPAIVVGPGVNGTGPRERLERALVANVQRSEMHPIEEGMAYKKMMKEFKYGIKDVARRTGRNYTRIHYCLSLLKLEKDIQRFMLERRMPCEQKAITALLSVPRGIERVQLATALMNRKANAKMIIIACTKYNNARLGLRSRKTKGSLAVRMIEDADVPEWDALYQLGRVPPWPVVTDAVMKTCDDCPLRKIASDTTCKGCALVEYLRHMMEAVHVH